jgi:hypothetical protein
MLNKMIRIGFSVAFLVIALLSIAFAVYALSPYWTFDFGPYFFVGSVFSTINTVLSIILLISYVGTYSKTKAEFNLVLVIIALTLLSYSIVAFLLFVQQLVTEVLVLDHF